MRYVVDINQKQAESVDDLIQKGRYNNFAQFIATAVENQIYIETNDHSEQNLISEKNSSDISTKDFFSNRSGFKQMMLSEIGNNAQVVPAPEFSSLAVSLYKAEEGKCWLWGQTNKILPVKIGLRALYTMLDSEQWVNLEEFRERAACIAANIRAAIKSHEKQKGKMRDELISAGLPNGRKQDSLNRYKGQFLAYTRKDGILEGALPFFRFANLKRDEKGKMLIGLTNEGLEFAKTTNPVIDHQNFDKSFGEEEINFYLKHIDKNVKGESGAFKWLLSTLSAGVHRRDAINLKIKQELARFWNDASDAVVNTQRAGLMSRMFELGLIEKKKEGITVAYNISERGEKFLLNK